ncbi:MAG: transporter, partial [Geminicoccales bacterium]
MNTKLAAAFLLFCLSAAIDAQAAHPLITEDTGTQGAGRYQLEALAEELEARGTRRDIEVWRGVLSYGIAETADVQVGVPLYRDGPDGVGDASLDLKWR